MSDLNTSATDLAMMFANLDMDTAWDAAAGAHFGDPRACLWDVVEMDLVRVYGPETAAGMLADVQHVMGVAIDLGDDWDGSVDLPTFARDLGVSAADADLLRMALGI